MQKFIRWVAVVLLVAINNTTHAQQDEEHGTGLLFESINTRSIPQKQPPAKVAVSLFPDPVPVTGFVRIATDDSPKVFAGPFPCRDEIVISRQIQD